MQCKKCGGTLAYVATSAVPARPDTVRDTYRCLDCGTAVDVARAASILRPDAGGDTPPDALKLTEPPRY